MAAESGGADEFETCDFCRCGRVVPGMETFRFTRQTAAGPVRCEVAVTIGRCEACGFAHVDAAAEAIIQGAGGS